MSLTEIIILSLIQGLTEFLPVSSSAHLILPSQLLGWTDQGLAFDVAVHVGSLLAVCWYFRQEIGQLWLGFWGSLQGKWSVEAQISWGIIVATIPAGLAGLLLADWIDMHLRSVAVIAIATMVFGVLLGVADRWGSQHVEIGQCTLKTGFILGLAQAIAIIPGTSRSGVTMTMGLLLGLTRQAAARYSFLMSIPVICLAGGYFLAKLIQQANMVDWQVLIVGAALAYLSALACIHLFLNIISRMGMMPFVIYRLLLGIILWVFFV